jgi:hypothetical protein
MRPKLMGVAVFGVLVVRMAFAQTPATAIPAVNEGSGRELNRSCKSG